LGNTPRYAAAGPGRPGRADSGPTPQWKERRSCESSSGTIGCSAARRPRLNACARRGTSSMKSSRRSLIAKGAARGIPISPALARRPLPRVVPVLMRFGPYATVGRQVAEDCRGREYEADHNKKQQGRLEGRHALLVFPAPSLLMQAASLLASGLPLLPGGHRSSRRVEKFAFSRWSTLSSDRRGPRPPHGRARDGPTNSTRSRQCRPTTMRITRAWAFTQCDVHTPLVGTLTHHVR